MRPAMQHLRAVRKVSKQSDFIVPKEKQKRSEQRRGDLQQKPSTYRATRTSLLLVKNSDQEYSSSTGWLKACPV